MRSQPAPRDLAFEPQRPTESKAAANCETNMLTHTWLSTRPHLVDSRQILLLFYVFFAPSLSLYLFRRALLQTNYDLAAVFIKM